MEKYICKETSKMTFDDKTSGKLEQIRNSGEKQLNISTPPHGISTCQLYPAVSKAVEETLNTIKQI